MFSGNIGAAVLWPLVNGINYDNETVSLLLFPAVVFQHISHLGKKMNDEF